MGVDGFGSLLRKQCPAVFRSFTDAMLVRKRVAIDMHIVVYQMFHRNGGNSNAVYADVKRFMDRLRSIEVTPTFVFDGKTTGLKPRAHQIRKDAAMKSETLLTKLRTENAELTDTLTRVCYSTVPEEVHEDLDELLSKKNKLDVDIAKASVRVTRPSFELFRNIKTQIKDVFGDGAVQQAEDDGERRVAELARLGHVDFAVSSDYDTLAFGSPNLIVNILHPENMSLLLLDEVLMALGLENIHQLRDFCILCGCDFCTKIPSIGPVSALKIIKTYKCIETAMAPALAAKISKSGITFEFEFARRRFEGGAMAETVPLRSSETATVDEPVERLDPSPLTDSASELSVSLPLESAP